MSVLRRIASFVCDLAGARLCPICHSELLDDEHGICLHCLATLPRCNSSVLSVHFAHVLNNAVAPQGVTESWFDYNPASAAASAIRTAKYNDRPRLAYELGYTFGKELLRRYGGDFPSDVLLPVPMHWFKRMCRGYNQSIEIARGLARATGASVGDNLIAVRPHQTQTHKSDAARRRNVSGIIGINHPEELDGLRVAIVDDIITTGATMAECVAAISFSGARPASLGFITLGATNSSCS